MGSRFEKVVVAIYFFHFKGEGANYLSTYG